MSNRNVAQAVRVALVAAGAVSAGLYGAASAAQEQLEEIVVTGTRIKRVDIETASPVFVFDSKQLSLGGAATFGEVIAKTPSIAGAATNPQVNNGGGTGATTVSLRGLGSERTLVLLNGRRTILGNDINAIPQNFVERVEILKDGASATYGSDAIGGVVNFITKKQFDGVEASAQYGQSERGDADQNVVTFTMGTSSDKGRLMLGAMFNDRKPVSSGDRPFSKEPWALYYGEQISLGSSRAPSGYYLIPRTTLVASGFDTSDPNCSTTAANLAVTKKDGTPGTSGADFRCFIGGGPNNDTFNFQPDNVVVTPQKRYGLFVQGGYDLAENVEVFAEGTYHWTQAAFQIAPEPFDGRPPFANVQISALNYYSPWGDRVLGAGNGVTIADSRKRLVDVGLRKGEYTTNRAEMTLGLRGDFRDWSWELAGTHGTERQESRQIGELYTPRLADALGPSRLNAQGAVECYNVTTGAAISGCIPYNIFAEPGDPANQAALAALVPERHGVVDEQQTHVTAGISGNLFELPAGAVGAAVGASYDRYYLNDQPDFLDQQGLSSGGCCAGAAKGSFSVKSGYVELLVPVLADAPLAHALNLSLGWSYSEYSNFGNTDNGKIGLEWRPVRQLLVRGTYAEVFRAPGIYDLFQAPQVSADQFNDPCNGLTAAILASNPNAAAACQNVPTDGSFSQTDSQLPAFYGGNQDTQPESGEVYTYGFLWNPTFLDSRMEFAVDYYNVSLKDTIGEIGTNNILRQCFNQGLYCSLFQRNSSGEVSRLLNVTQNIGKLDADGIDFGFRYDFGQTSLGNFRFSLDTTHLLSWDNEKVAGLPETLRKRAGTFVDDTSGGDGHFAKWRALAGLTWAWQNWEAAATARYIGTVTEFTNNTNCDASVSAANIDGLCPRNIAAQTLVDLEGSYNFADQGLTVTIGVNNVTDELAPILYSGFNGTTDVRTYDGIGRFYFARLNWKM